MASAPKKISDELKDFTKCDDEETKEKIKKSVDEILEKRELDDACKVINDTIKDALKNKRYIYHVISEWYKLNANHQDSSFISNWKDSKVFKYETTVNSIKYSVRVYRFSL